MIKECERSPRGEADESEKRRDYSTSRHTQQYDEVRGEGWGANSEWPGSDTHAEKRSATAWYNECPRESRPRLQIPSRFQINDGKTASSSSALGLRSPSSKKSDMRGVLQGFNDPTSVQTRLRAHLVPACWLYALARRWTHGGECGRPSARHARAGPRRAAIVVRLRRLHRRSGSPQTATRRCCSPTINCTQTSAERDCTTAQPCRPQTHPTSSDPRQSSCLRRCARPPCVPGSDHDPSHADILLQARKDKAGRTKDVGSPIAITGKALAIEVRGNVAWIAENTTVIRKLSLEVRPAPSVATRRTD